MSDVNWPADLTKVSMISGLGMITLRGDLSVDKIRKTVKRVVGVAIPQPQKFQCKDGRICAWMSPDELLILVDVIDVSTIIDMLKSALSAEHCLIQNVSDARVIHAITGAGIRDVLAKLSPVNMSPDAFGQGQFRRSRIGQVAGAFWMPDENSIQIASFRSTSSYMSDLLNHAARSEAAVGFNSVAS